MKILYVASECIPFCKTGGLADVVGTLPKALKDKRHDVRIILPKYKAVRAPEFGIRETGHWVRIPMGWGRVESADIRATKLDNGIPVYFVNHDGYYGRPGLYMGPHGDYTDNGERFIFFCRAALEACKALSFQPDIIHCHDWQTGLIPMYLRILLKNDPFFQRTASVITIHNIAYQGVFPKSLLEVTGFSWNEFTMDKFEYYDEISFLKAGLVFSNLITTVSPTYAREIQSSYEFGWGMEGLLKSRAKDLIGIVNGLDVKEWNPAKDPFLAEPYSRERLKPRRACKAALQENQHFPVDPDVPVLGMVARIDPQKGVDLLAKIIPSLMNRHNVQIVILGQGDPFLMRQLDFYVKQYPGHIRLCTDFNEPLAHHIYAGSDLFLMPSRFEPCGLSQMIAMRYGSIPIAANTGGLHDTIKHVSSDHYGTGFLFQPDNATAFLASIQEALRHYKRPAAWATLQRRAMQEDFSWERSLPAYLDTYRKALGRKTPRKARSRKTV